MITQRGQKTLELEAGGAEQSFNETISTITPASSMMQFSFTVVVLGADVTVRGRIVDATTLEFKAVNRAGQPVSVYVNWEVCDFGA